MEEAAAGGGIYMNQHFQSRNCELSPARSFRKGTHAPIVLLAAVFFFPAKEAWARPPRARVATVCVQAVADGSMTVFIAKGWGDPRFEMVKGHKILPLRETRSSFGCYRRHADCHSISLALDWESFPNAR